MTMPTQVSALGFLQLITKMGLKNSFIPLIIPSIAAPAVFFFMKQYLDASLPMEIVEAARIDGAGEFYTFNHIVLPIMKPALAVQAIFSFVSSWNNYFIPALVLDTADKKTLPILIAQLRSADFLKFDMGKVYMLVAIAILPVIIVYLLLSKFIVRGVALGGVKAEHSVLSFGKSTRSQQAAGAFLSSRAQSALAMRCIAVEATCFSLMARSWAMWSVFTWACCWASESHSSTMSSSSGSAALR